jgi:hypothetical protein
MGNLHPWLPLHLPTPPVRLFVFVLACLPTVCDLPVNGSREEKKKVVQHSYLCVRCAKDLFGWRAKVNRAAPFALYPCLVGEEPERSGSTNRIFAAYSDRTRRLASVRAPSFAWGTNIALSLLPHCALLSPSPRRLHPSRCWPPPVHTLPDHAPSAPFPVSSSAPCRSTIRPPPRPARAGHHEPKPLRPQRGPSASAARDSQERPQARKLLFLCPLTPPMLLQSFSVVDVLSIVLLMIMGEQVGCHRSLLSAHLGW